jgi:hypothetical protein
MSNPADLLASMGLDAQMIDIHDISKSNNRSVDRRICVCGHSVDRHKNYFVGDGSGVPVLRTNNPDDSFTCKPNAATCNCKKVIPVLSVSNPKYFLKKTDGAGQLHALSRGIRALMKVDGATAEWIIDPQCRTCGSKVNVVPACFTLDGRLKQGTGSDGYDAFICENCRVVA